MKRPFLLLQLAMLLLLQFPAIAWSGAGHMVIAAEAYRQLPAGVKDKVIEILKSHPEYENWKESFARDSGNVDLGLFIFMRASTWPDEIRRHGNRYDHPHWHYIDYPLRPPSFLVEPGPAPTDDVLYGIAQSEKVLPDAKAPAQERAVYLSWLLHLVGDLHQPLHCSSLFTDAYPTGDKGGNSFFIKPASRGIALHSFWDGLLGTSGKPQSRLDYAIQIATEYPSKALPELQKSRTPKEWALESRSLAVERVYLRGELKGGADKEAAPLLPEGYTKASKALAEHQAALAGYRLADEIQRLVR